MSEFYTDLPGDEPQAAFLAVFPQLKCMIFGQNERAPNRSPWDRAPGSPGGFFRAPLEVSKSIWTSLIAGIGGHATQLKHGVIFYYGVKYTLVVF